MPFEGRGRGGTWAALLLGVGVVVTFAEALLGRVPTMRDLVGFTFPSRAVWRDVVTSGDVSGWNPLAEIGLPRLAAPVHGALYPGHLSLLVGSLETGMMLTWLAHVAWAALGGYALSRALGARPVAAVVSGALWAFGGYAVSMWWNGEKVLTDAWLPWFALAVHRTVRARGTLSLEGAALAFATAMICYAGDPFLLFDAVGLAAATLFVEGASGPRERLAGIARGAVAIVLGIGIAAPTLLPALSLRADTPRGAALSQRAAEAWSMHPARIAELFVPGWFGNPFDVEHYPGGVFADDPTVQALPWAVSIYAGAAIVVFVPAVRSRRALAALGGGAVLFLLLALGRHTPVSEAFRFIVPGLSLSRYPEKHLVVALGLLGLLASLGIERALSERVAWWRLGVAPLVFVALAVILAPHTLRASALSGAAHVAIASALLVLATRVAVARPPLVWILGLVSVLDLAVAARPFLHWVPRPLFASPFAQALRGRAGGAPPRLFRPRAGDFEDATTLPDAAAQVLGISVLPGHDPARSVRLDTVTRALQDRPRRLAQLLALDAWMLPTDTPVGMAPELTVRGWSLYLLPRAPRAWIVAAARREEPLDALQRIASEAFDPYAEATLSAPADREVLELEQEEKGRAGTCEVVAYRRASIDLTCDARRSGLVVLSELDAEGWKGFVDGREQTLYATDIVLRGIRVGSGRHLVTLKYETPGLDEGCIVGGLCALILALGVFASRQRGAAAAARD